MEQSICQGTWVVNNKTVGDPFFFFRFGAIALSSWQTSFQRHRSPGPNPSRCLGSYVNRSHPSRVKLTLNSLCLCWLQA